MMATIIGFIILAIFTVMILFGMVLNIMDFIILLCIDEERENNGNNTDGEEDN